MGQTASGHKSDMTAPSRDLIPHFIRRLDKAGEVYLCCETWSIGLSPGLTRVLSGSLILLQERSDDFRRDKVLKLAECAALRKLCNLLN